jgi:signal transduction histidine kinase
LTNVVKHAGPATARVHVRYDDDQLIVEVTDDGKGSADGLRDGNGTIGMRERTSMWGGGLEMGPWPPGGWRVWARLPLEVRP